MATTMSRETLQTNLSTQSLDCQRETHENSGDNIRVYVRVRPATEREQTVAAQPILAISRETSSVLLRGDQPRTFTFDGVLGEESSQEEAFDLVGRKMAYGCLAGYNGSVYVYGQTGAGKTYTQFGPISSVQSMHFDDRRGLLCRILDHVFAEIHRRRGQTEGVSYLCRCSFLEIYKEQIADLLEPGNSNLQVREDMNRGVYVERLSEPTVWSLTEAFQVLWKGLQQRHIGATQMNEKSSRSHAVFTLSVEVASTRAGVTSTRIARLSLVDLAGSERQQGSVDASGVAAPYQSLRVKEAGAINRSLSALTNVIMSLSRAATSRRRSSGDGRRPYVHYRDSKLTFLLRDSLGGNSKTAIVANMSPSALNFAETLSTLKFAARAKHIRCAAVRNEEYSGTVESLMEEVKGLRLQLAQLSSRGFAASRAQLIDAAAAARENADEEHAGNEDDESQVLYSRKRVRRLEVLLAAGLERERHADHRRHHLHRLAEFLEDLDFRKEQYMRTLHKDYTALVAQIQETIPTDSNEETVELTSKLVGFSQLLANLVPGKLGSGPLSDAGKDAAGGVFPPAMEGSESSENLAGARGSPAQARPARKRGTSQSLQRGGPERITGTAAGNPQATDSALSSSRLLHNSSFPGAFADEAAVLREENKRLEQQLERHPEVSRLAAENRALRAQLVAIDALSSGGRNPSRVWPPGSRGSRGTRPFKQDGRHENLLTKTLRSAAGMAAGSPIKDTSNPLEAIGKVRSRAGSTEIDLDSMCEPSGAAPAEEEEPIGPPVTSAMMQRIAEVDEDSTLRAWVHFQKMAKEVEELIRAKENLSGMMKQMDSSDGQRREASLRAKGDAAQAKASSLRNSVEPQVVEDLVQTTHDALALAHTIIDSRDAQPLAGASADDSFVSADEADISGAWLQRNSRLSSSSPQFLANAQGAGSLLNRKQSSKRQLGSVSEQDTEPPSAPFPLSGLHNTPAAVAASAMRGSSPRAEPAEKVEIRQAMQRVKHLHGTLDLVNNTYNDAYDQFQRLREEYENRLEECQFFELQCSRLDMHCHELAERLHGVGAPRSGIGSFSATGFSPASSSSQQRRCFSLSSLRCVNFWEQRFQELSQLTGIDEADRGQQVDGASAVGGPTAAAGSAPGAYSISRPQPLSLSAASRMSRPAVVVSARQPMLHSMSLSALQPSEEENMLRGRAPASGASAAGETGPVVRRVASAPLLPSPAELRQAGRAQVPPLAPLQLPTPLQQPTPSLSAATSLSDLSEMLKNRLAADSAVLARQPLERPMQIQYPPERAASPPLPSRPSAAVPVIPVLASASSSGAATASSAPSSAMARQLSSSFSGQDLLGSRAPQPQPLSSSRHLGSDSAGQSSATALASGTPGSTSCGSISSRDVLGRAGAPQVLSGSSPRVATAGAAAGTRPSASPAVASQASAPPPASSGTASAGLGSAGASSTSARPVVGSTLRTQSGAGTQRSQSRGLRTAPRFVSSGVTSARGGQLAYPSASAALQQRPGP